MLYDVLTIITYVCVNCQYIIIFEVKRVEEKLIINKKSLKGEDGYKTFSIRIKDETVNKLNDLAKETNRSRNELVNILLEYAIENSTVL